MGSSSPTRARSGAQKAARETAILSATRTCVAEVGYDGVTMALLARRSGVAKGTLYLYFRTREEVFLRLFCSLLHEVVAAICSFEARGIDKMAVLITRAALADPLFLTLLARRAVLIERNVPAKALHHAQHLRQTERQRLAAHLAAMLNWPVPKALTAAGSCFVILQGISLDELATTSLANRSCPPAIGPVSGLSQVLRTILKGA